MDISLIMKKYIVLLTYFLGTASLYAEGRLGVQIAPTISFGGVYTEPNSLDFTSRGFALRTKVGAIYDYSFQDNYNVSTGLFYAGHRFALKNEQKNPQIQEVHELHYLQIPVLFKPYTSEVALDLRVYITLGVIGKVLLTARNTELEFRTTPFINGFRRLGLAGLVGGGVEYDTSFSTSVFAGISYQPDLRAVNAQHKSNNNGQLLGYTRLISIDLGARF